MIGALLAALGVALFAWGHDVRDGNPGFKGMLAGLVGTRWEWVYHLSTHFARALGGALCGLGGLAIFGPTWAALACWLGIWGGFYFDQKHGEGQANQGFAHDAPYLALSGLTSLLPLSILLGALYFVGAGLPREVFLVQSVGVVKVAIWPLCWRFISAGPGTRFWPTRVAAILFGAAIGAFLAIAVR
jgi:hypothetical protein